MWKIKDPELKRKVNQFFTDEEINAECKRCVKDEDSEFLCFFMDGIDIQFHIRKSYFEEVPEYNPDDWNPFPKVTPKSDIVYLVTLKAPSGQTVVTTSLYLAGFGWRKNFNLEVIAFREFPKPYQLESNK